MVSDPKVEERPHVRQGRKGIREYCESMRVNWEGIKKVQETNERLTGKR